ncbi:hypothetical protein Q4E40_02565 [Pontibacter sp. BT731]|nr:hypothetical protein [Pontibacter sp. BT731]MDO6388995.1 hypothetical protein [Pontibacter sp. BT731]
MRWELSWVDLTLLLATLPTYEKEGGKKEETVREEDEEKKLRQLFGY